MVKLWIFPKEKLSKFVAVVRYCEKLFEMMVLSAVISVLEKVLPLRVGLTWHRQRVWCLL